MRPWRKHRGGVVCLWFVAALSARAQTVNTLNRPYEVIVVPGGLCPSYLGESTDGIRVYRYDSVPDGWEAVPFQVDELDGGDSYFGPKNGILDGGDEIVFLARDAGDMAPPGSWPADDDVKEYGRYRIELADPLDSGQRGWIYLYYSSTLATSPLSYIGYISSEDKVVTNDWWVKHGSSGFQEEIVLNPVIFGNNENIVDRQKIRIRGRYTEGLDFSVRLNEEGSERIKVINFPPVYVTIRTSKGDIQVTQDPVIRLHRRLRWEVDIAIPILSDLHYDLPAVTTFYPFFSEMDFSELPLSMISDIGQLKEVRFTLDLNSSANGMTLTNEYQTQTIRIDGVADDPIVTTLDWPGQNWTLISADPTFPGSVLDEGSILALYRFLGSPAGDVQRLYFKDDASGEDDSDTGDRYSWGDTGIQVEGSDISGTINFYQAYYYVPETIEIDAARTLADQHFSPVGAEGTQEEFVYVVTVDTEPAGLQVEVDGAVLTAPATFYWTENSVHDLCAPETAAETGGNRYRFDGWSNSGTRCQTIAVTGSMELTASYALQRFLATSVTPGGTGGIDPASPGAWFDASSLARVFATASDGFVFRNWEGDASGTENPFFVRMDAPKDITAVFVAVRNITVGTEPPGLWFAVDDQPYDSEQTFPWMVGSIHSVCLDSIQERTAGERHRFEAWSDGGARCHDVVVAGEDDSVIAGFRKQYYLGTAEDPADAGYVLPPPPGVWHDEGEEAVVEAAPAGWYAFIEWTGDLAGSVTPDTLLMNSPKDVTAHFGNYAPVVAMPDTSWAEDDTLSIDYGTLRGWMDDANNGSASLEWTVSGGGRVVVLDDEAGGRIRLFGALRHWNGEDTVTVTVTDPLGAKGEDRVVVNVTPVPDPPGPFSLLGPPDEELFSSWPDRVDFSWEASYDPDVGDTVWYAFEMDTAEGFDSGLYTRVDSLMIPSLPFDWPPEFGDGRYYWRVEASDGILAPIRSNEVFTLALATAAGDGAAVSIPDEYMLEQNYPNPFNAGTVVRFGIPESGDVRLVVYNAHGRLVRTLIRGRREAGYHSVSWQGTDDAGQDVASGLYFLRFAGEGFGFVKKMILLR